MCQSVVKKCHKCLMNIFGTFLKKINVFCRKVLMLRFTHFFRNFFVSEKQTLQTFLFLECMPVLSELYICDCTTCFGKTKKVSKRSRAFLT